MATYSTSQIAAVVGIHPNTVRLYERIGFITAPARKQNGYRIFTEVHLLQVQLVRAALGVELVQNDLRKEVLAIIRAMASQDFDQALHLTEERLVHLHRERCTAQSALAQVQLLLEHAQGGPSTHKTEAGPGAQAEVGTKTKANATAPANAFAEVRQVEARTRREAANFLDTTIDSLRNWEMNGLLQVKRRRNGYRVYSAADLNRLTIIRTLRAANYSLTAIMRMLSALDRNANANIEQVLDTPSHDEDILSACDNLLTSLDEATQNALHMKDLLHHMKEIT